MRALFTASVWGSGGHMGLKIKAYRKKLKSSLEEICVSSSLAAVRRAGLPLQGRQYTGCQSSKGIDHFPILVFTATSFWKSIHSLSLSVPDSGSALKKSGRILSLSPRSRSTYQGLCVYKHISEIVFPDHLCAFMIDFALPAVY